MPVAYLIVEMNITDMEQYKQYMAEAPASVKAFGGEYLVRGGKQETQWHDHAQLHQGTRRTLPATTGHGNAATARRRGVESRHTTSGAEQTS